MCLMQRGDVWTKKTGDGHGLANGLDRGRVYVVVNMPARDVLAFQVLQLLLKATPRWNTISGIQHHSSSGMRTSKCYHGHDQMITVDQEVTRPERQMPRII